MGAITIDFYNMEEATKYWSVLMKEINPIQLQKVCLIRN